MFPGFDPKKKNTYGSARRNPRLGGEAFSKTVQVSGSVGVKYTSHTTNLQGHKNRFLYCRTS